MRPLIAEIVISLGDPSDVCRGTLYESEIVHIRLHDDGAGPFLSVKGTTEYEGNGVTPDHFMFDSIEQINRFAAACRRMLRQYE